MPSENTFCVLPFSHIFISPQGEMKPCCRFRGKDWREHSDESVSSAFQGLKWQQLRQQMLEGKKIAGCVRCYEEEGAGKKSLRQRYNDNVDLGTQKVDVDQPQILWLEIPFSNRCNVACRMCDSRYSTRWMKEDQKEESGSQKKVKIFDFDIKTLKKVADDLEHVKVTGGEPFFDRKHRDFLQIMAQSKNASNVFLNYSTNLTIFPDDEIFRLWSKFKRVELALSLDSIIPEETHYTRYPTNGDLALKNVEKFFAALSEYKNLVLILRSTISAYNIYSLPEMLKWWDQLKTKYPESIDRVIENPTHLTYPEELAATALNEKQKKQVSSHFFQMATKLDPKHQKILEYIENYMNSRNDLNLHRKFLDETKRLDQIRNQSASQVFQHL